MRKNRKADVAIIGGGASGLAAAVELGMSSPELSVLVIEKMKEPGRKLRATGSGRCNIANAEAAGIECIKEFFSDIGLMIKTNRDGLMYPYSESAANVVSIITDRAASLGCEFCCEEEAIKIKKCEGGGFEIESAYKDKDGSHSMITEANYIILACGGKAAPNYGTTGDGYRLAKELGHSVVTPVPVLTGIECAEWNANIVPDAHIMAGTRTTGRISLYKREAGEAPTYPTTEKSVFPNEYPNKEPFFTEKGEIQFTKYGLSGICVFNMSRLMRLNKEEGERFEDYCIKLNLFPEGSFSDYLNSVSQGKFAKNPLKTVFILAFKESVARYIIESLNENAGCKTAMNNGAGDFCDKSLYRLSAEDIRLVCEAVHGLEFHPINLRGWKDAQVTSGGVSMNEIDKKTAESKLVKGLYITGELADRDFPCGGFNLSNAWLTGISAADDIAAKER